MIAARRAPRSLATPIAFSALLHAAILGPLVLARRAPPLALPPMYRVHLLAAPPGLRAAGVVSDAPAPVAPAKALPKAAARTPPARTPLKAKAATAPPKATPNVQAGRVAADAPKAGAGAEGATGADVATVRTEGIEFPYPVYLANIVRQIALNFRPQGNVGALRAEVFFMVRRDGSVAGFRFLTRSGSVAFDLECHGAVEAASRAFGALPAGFSDDVLPVIFFFDPSKLR